MFVVAVGLGWLWIRNNVVEVVIQGARPSVRLEVGRVNEGSQVNLCALYLSSLDALSI